MININDLSEKEQIEIVKKTPFSVRYIKNPSARVQLTAVENYTTIPYINNPIEEIQLMVIKKNPTNIRNIKNPSELTQMEAVNNFKYYDTVSDAFVEYYIKSPNAKNLYEKLKAVHKIIK
jgi:hypothetical protein